jgi:hypothetical protein
MDYHERWAGKFQQLVLVGELSEKFDISAEEIERAIRDK